MALPERKATFTAPTNIAVVKYWGKRSEGDGGLNLPINDSLSVTLNQDDLSTTTTVTLSTEFEKDRLWLNGKEEDCAGNKRVQTVLREIRARAGTKEDSPAVDWSLYKAHIVSENNFPTAAGLASSAAGYACLTICLAEVFCVGCGFRELSTIARQGSGSASRSLFGGLVAWRMGSLEDGSDSVAEQVATETHWPELSVLICVVSDAKKETGSTVGMSTSVKTSALLAHRRSLVPSTMAKMERAIAEKDFATFAELTMRDSNQFHATCLDTFPPIFYMNDTSRRIIGLVHKLNAALGRTACCYTFDAGPNAVLYCLDKDRPLILALLLQHFPAPSTPTADTYLHTSHPTLAKDATTALESLPEHLLCPAERKAEPGSVKAIFATTPGDGPRKKDTHLPTPKSETHDDSTPTPTAAAAAGGGGGGE